MPSDTQPEIFISYRRDDSSGHAGRLFDCMRERFGDEAVFMDVTDIRPGVDFAVALDGALSSCRVVLVVIGTQWLTSTDATGRRRLEDPDDHLRIEIVQALRRNVHVIPVLVRGAAMPRERDLPEDLQPLARRQAHEVSDSRWSYDTDQLLRIVQNNVGERDRGDGRTRSGQTTIAGAAGEQWSRNPDTGGLRRGWPRIAVPAGALIAGGVIVALMWSGSGGEHPAADGVGSANNVGRVVVDSGAPPVTFRRAPAANPSARLPASAEVRAGDGLFRVLGGLVSGDTSGAHTVRLLIRTTNVRAPHGMIISADVFRIIADGSAMAPDEAPIEVVAMQSAVERWVQFRIPAAAAAVALQVGDVRQATATIPIDLRSVATDVIEMPASAMRHPTDIPVTFEKRAGPVVYAINGMRLEHFSDAVPPFQPEKLELSVKVRMKNVGAPYGYAAGSNDFRLLIDEVPLAPTSTHSYLLTYQNDTDAEVLFVMPGNARTAVLQLGNISADTVRVPIDLSAARPPAPR